MAGAPTPMKRSSLLAFCYFKLVVSISLFYDHVHMFVLLTLGVMKFHRLTVKYESKSA